MKDPERNKIIYVTADSSYWMIIDVPFGMISPPTIELHRPHLGPITFQDAVGYQLPIPPEAKRA